MEYYIGIDLGGTNIAAGLVNSELKVVDSVSCPTALPRPAAQVEADMAALCRTLVEKNGLTLADLAWVGIGTPGSVDPTIGFVGFNANFGYHNWYLGPDMEKLLGCKVYVENDANAAAYGEYAAGALKGASFAIMITLGTGVGAGIILDGKLYSGYNHSGGELGHMVIVKDGRPCMCGRRGCWEKYASARALAEDMQAVLRANPEDALWKKLDGNIEKVDARFVFDAVAQGSKTAKAILENYQEYVACGLTNLINIFQPEIVCVGGGVSKQGEILLAPIRSYVDREEYARTGEKRAQIVPAQLFNDAGIVGAALLGCQG